MLNMYIKKTSFYHIYTNFFLYKQNIKHLFVGDEIEHALEEAPDQELPYVCVEGTTESVGPPLRSMYHPECERGVIQKISLIEHRSRRNQGYWYVTLLENKSILCTI